jgi:ribonuclease HI
MSVSAPHFLLFSESQSARHEGDWRFVLQAADGSTKLEVEDAEPDMRGERLELLAVVRGLEALEQPSRVTLVTASRYVSRGLNCSLPEWRESGWQWEHHGQMVPIKNRDLWQRLDRALRVHRVQCRSWRFDAASPITRSASASRLTERDRETIHRAGQRSSLQVSPLEAPVRVKTARRPLALGTGRNRRRWLLACRRRLGDFCQGVRLRLAQCGTSWLPIPWLE